MTNPRFLGGVRVVANEFHHLSGEGPSYTSYKYWTNPIYRMYMNV